MERQVPDFIQKKGAALSGLNAPDPIIARIRESPSCVAPLTHHIVVKNEQLRGFHGP